MQRLAVAPPDYPDGLVGFHAVRHAVQLAAAAGADALRAEANPDLSAVLTMLTAVGFRRYRTHNSGRAPPNISPAGAVTRVLAAERTIGRTVRDPVREVTEFTLDNNRVRVAVWNYGATLVSVVVPDLAGARRNVVIRLPDLAAYEAAENRAYVGSTMGRFARIVAGGRLVIDGREYELARNAGPHHIHGGPEGFDARVWDGHADSGEKSGRVVLTLVSPDGDQGYPGELIATTTYELDIHNRLTIEFTATTDAPTLCGLSNHAFWNLGSEPRIDGHELQLHARACLRVTPTSFRAVARCQWTTPSSISPTPMFFSG